MILNSTEPNFPEVKIDICIAPEDLKIFADPNLMGQVLLNLMKNAFYALRGREDAHITLSAEHGPTGKVLIRVRANGPGIPPEIMNEIFVPFFTTKEEGSGIGLSVSRQIMRMHGGNLKVSSIEGKETVFTIIIWKWCFIFIWNLIENQCISVESDRMDVLLEKFFELG